MTLPSKVKRLGTTKPTPFPLRGGATTMMWVGELSCKYSIQCCFLLCHPPKYKPLLSRNPAFLRSSYSANLEEPCRSDSLTFRRMIDENICTIQKLATRQTIVICIPCIYASRLSPWILADRTSV